MEYFTNLNKQQFCYVFQLEHVPTILQDLHSGVGGGHFSLDVTVRKFLMLVIGGQPWMEMFMNFVEPMICTKKQVNC
jgi:hypothetical protein